MNNATLDEVKNAYNTFSVFLKDGPPVEIEGWKKINSTIFPDSAFPEIKKIKKRPHFDQKTYPSIGTDIPLVNIDGICDCDKVNLPASMAPHDISAYIKNSNDPFLKMVLGLVWKQGDFNQLTMVFRGVRNQKLGRKDPVVMWQFGRHMCCPLSEPIFDQHTYRAFILLTNLPGWSQAQHTVNDLKTVLASNNAAANKLKSLKTTHLDYYLLWWKSCTIGIRGINPNINRYLLLQAFDRLMFSLGKAASI